MHHSWFHQSFSWFKHQMFTVPPTLTFFKVRTPNHHGSTNIVQGFVYTSVHGSMNIVQVPR